MFRFLLIRRIDVEGSGKIKPVLGFPIDFIARRFFDIPFMEIYDV
jgi:hypothetical protein